jgi:hypothetical protein
MANTDYKFQANDLVTRAQAFASAAHARQVL